MTTDVIDQAIKATAHAQTTTISVSLSSGRRIAVVVPVDLTLQETVDMVSFVASGLRPELRRQSRPALSRLALPSSVRS